MNTVMYYLRKAVGSIIKFFDSLTRPEPVQRPPDEQEVIEIELEKMAVYEFDG